MSVVQQKEGLIEELMGLWHKYSHEYRTLVRDYEKLRREMNGIPLGRDNIVSRNDIKNGFPQETDLIGKFLGTADKKSALELLQGCSLYEIKRLLREISGENVDRNGYVNNYVRKHIKSAIKNLESRKKYWGFKDTFGIDPRACSGKPKTVATGARAAKEY